MIENLALSRWLRRPWIRRGVAVTLILILGLLALYPQKYRAVATMTPADPASLGLGGALGQLGAYSSVFGSQAAIEVALKVGRSQDVRSVVIQRLDLQKRRHFSNLVETDRWLEHQVDIRALRGGILQVDSRERDPDLALELVSAFVKATRDRLSLISRNQTSYKRDVLLKLVDDSSARLARAQAAYDSFRRGSRFSEPSAALGAIGTRVPAIEQMLKAKEVELQQARSFATDNNMSVRQILAEMAAMRTQLAEAKNLDASQPNSVNRVIEQSTEVQKLQRDLSLAQNLYDNYKRYLLGTSVEDLTSDATIRMIEQPYLETDRQYNMMPAALLLLIILTWGAMEFYLLRPPVGAMRQMVSPK